MCLYFFLKMIFEPSVPQNIRMECLENHSSFPTEKYLIANSTRDPWCVRQCDRASSIRNEDMAEAVDR